MMRCLSAGAVRQKTALPASGARSAARRSSSRRSSSKKASPSKARSASSGRRPRMPSSRATATAVSRESPEMTKTRIPARSQRSMAAAASGRGGSRMPTTPTSVSSVSRAAWPSASRRAGGSAASPRACSSRSSGRRSRVARARQRSGREAISAHLFCQRRRSALERRRETPVTGSRTATQRLRTASGAPLTRRRGPGAGRSSS
mmetsp:Transcript_22292/g.69819  ORF Transcript_22292/g.69819 Transcript_22292/m.69819 type:complete len:204 (-) Transcript_22292:551-1162(-)